MKNIIKKLKNKNIESAFSLLENALRSEQSPAMLTQSQVCSSHTLLRKSAFSLAEVMVLLTIVAIMLALSAPLISKPSNTDPQHLLKKGIDNEVIIANGNYQVLNVGMNNSKKLKLKVNGPFNTFKSDKTLKDRAESGLFPGILRILGDDNSRIIINENGFAMIRGDAETAQNTLFRVKPDGDINITVAQIDKTKTYRVGGDQVGSYTTAIEAFLPADGYLYGAPTGASAALNNELYQIGFGSSVSDLTNVFSIEYNSTYKYSGAENPYELDPSSKIKYTETIYRPTVLPNMVYKNKDDKYRVIPIRSYPMQIPVQKDMKAHCYGWSNGDQWKCGFWPMKENIKVNDQKSGSQVVFANDSPSCYLNCIGTECNCSK